MKANSLSRTFTFAAVALGALTLGSAAHARSDVFFSVGVHAPGVYVQPAQVYTQPAPVYVQPRPVYVQPAPVYVQPHPRWDHDRGHRYGDRRWDRRGPWGDRDGDGIANVHDPRDGSRHARRQGPHGDLDRDGVRNRHDRDADGDGVRNRHDRFPGDRYRY